MGTYTLKQRDIPLGGEYDVIVCGGGPAGSAAAAAAARDGARTLLIEATGSLGGMGTSGLVPQWCPFSDKEKMIYRGLAEKVFAQAKSAVLDMAAQPERLDWISVDPERVKLIYDNLVRAAGAQVLFFTQLCQVETGDDGAVQAIIVSNKSGLTAYRAAVYIDATGDADLAAWAGADFHKGDDQTGELQPVTHCFTISNVDSYHYKFGPNMMSNHDDCPMHAIFDSGKWPIIKDKHIVNCFAGPGTVGFNAGHLWEVDSTNPASLSQAMMDGRKLARALRDGLAECHPAAFAASHLAQTGTLMGVRESRRIVGDYALTIEDYLTRRSFPDEICRNAYPVDIHTNKDEAETGEEVDAMKRFEQFKPGESHGVPYRCLTPKGLRNVLVAGRCISTDRAVQGSTRVMPVCLCMGEAAGAAAAMSVESGDVHAVDTAALRTRLRQAGGWLPEPD